MGYTYTTLARNQSDASDTVLNASATIDLTGGETIVGFGMWYGGASDGFTIDNTAAGNTLTSFAEINNGSIYLRAAYKINATAGLAQTFRMSLTTARTYRAFWVVVFTPDGGETVTLDAGPSAGSGNGTAILTGNINTSGTDEIIVCGFNHYSGHDNVEACTIGEVAATSDSFGSGYYAVWYKVFSSDPGDAIHGDLTWGGASGIWVADIVALKSEAGGAGTTTARASSSTSRRRNINRRNSGLIIV